jgi:cellulose synthase/poly-beta-1,6-N-acetylglucosamine synthase-like glycosyltransferase
MMHSLKILFELQYYIVAYVVAKIWHFVLRKKSSQDELKLRKIKTKLQNVIYCYLIENRGVSKLSIIIPSYNEESEIASVIDACLSDSTVEIIVSDGGSTDSTKDIVLGYGDRVKYLSGIGIMITFDCAFKCLQYSV